MRSGTFVAGLAACMLLASAAHGDDADDVRAAAIQFFQQIGHESDDEAAAGVAGAAANRQLMIAYNREVAALARYKAACVAKFGSADKLAGPIAQTTTGNLLAILPSLAVAIRGDAASLYPQGDIPKNGLRMRRTAGVWKFDGFSFAPPKPREIELVAMLARNLDQATKKVNAGVYHSEEEAHRALAEAYMNEMAGPLTFGDSPAQ